MLINWICHTKPESDLFLYTKTPSNERLRPVYDNKITFGNCVQTIWIHQGYCVVKKLVWNICML